MRPVRIGIGGFASNVGKTELICELLQRVPGLEAVKTTRGHYRSCGKDPETCCVSHLLGSEPLVLSGRENNYTPGKDTARFWDAGARNVHWVIGTDKQISNGVERALECVRSRAVLIEGNSFVREIDVDFFIMVTRSDVLRPKSSAKRVMNKVSAVYISGDETEGTAFAMRQGPDFSATIYQKNDLPKLAQVVACLVDPDTGRFLNTSQLKTASYDREFSTVNGN